MSLSVLNVHNSNWVKVLTLKDVLRLGSLEPDKVIMNFIHAWKFLKRSSI